MKYVFYDGNMVTTIFHDEPQFPLDGHNYFVVDEIPISEFREGFKSKLLCNPETKEIYYEYEPIPLTPEERRIKELEGAVLELTEMIAQLQLQGGAN